MLRLGGLADDEVAARSAAADALDSGTAAAKFAAMAEAQGGDPAVVGDPSLLAAPAGHVEVRSGALGTVASVDSRGLGAVCVALGAGRARAEDEIDPSAGLVMAALPGDEVVEGDLLCTLQGAGDLDSHADAARACFTISGPGATVEPRRLLIERIGD
jgi:pyrimidine-nucleoside phosphorylase